MIEPFQQNPSPVMSKVVIYDLAAGRNAENVYKIISIRKITHNSYTDGVV